MPAKSLILISTVTAVVATMVLVNLFRWHEQAGRHAFLSRFRELKDDDVAALGWVRSHPQFIRGRDVNNEGLLTYAVEHEMPETTRGLIQLGLDPNESTLHGASLNSYVCYFGGSDELLDILIRGGARPPPRGEYSLLQAAASGLNLSCVRYLLDQGHDPNIDGTVGTAGPPAFLAIRALRGKEMLAVVQLLADTGFDLSAKFKGKTLLETIREDDGIDVTGQREIVESYLTQKTGGSAMRTQ